MTEHGKVCTVAHKVRSKVYLSLRFLSRGLVSSGSPDFAVPLLGNRPLNLYHPVPKYWGELTNTFPITRVFFYTEDGHRWFGDMSVNNVSSRPRLNSQTESNINNGLLLTI